MLCFKRTLFLTDLLGLALGLGLVTQDYLPLTLTVDPVTRLGTFLAKRAKKIHIFLNVFPRGAINIFFPPLDTTINV